MVGLPSVGQKVWVWPAPGRQVQHGARPVDAMGGGSWLSREGREVIWTEFHHEQMKAGDLMLHPPPDSQAALVTPFPEAETPKRSPYKKPDEDKE